ncbi:putative membrane-anchored protein [Salirhabdus euzebyi]|uniref:Putative membrane-anchored protein n=1 Tax=Salirhabdus euzebyi TaxID=394506 RepID=A0A841Q3N4_9BACI|nr:GDYXXLXY domain-containing protein [Salirhabdus euzebyi]MBB6453004.1 putative membrane-anchored protein [Salirhabdus euzebyi]
MKKIFFYLAVSLQVLFLLSMSVGYYLIDDVGEIVKLRTAPIDPPDLFYGDYVTLNYEAERIPADRWFVEEKVDYDEKIYVVLTPGPDGIYEVKSASKVKVNTDGDDVVMTAKYLYEEFDQMHQVDFGIGRYFIEDNTGEQYENGMTEMIVTVAIGPFGLKRILSLEPLP